MGPLETAEMVKGCCVHAARQWGDWAKGTATSWTSPAGAGTRPLPARSGYLRERRCVEDPGRVDSGLSDAFPSLAAEVTCTSLLVRVVLWTPCRPRPRRKPPGERRAMSREDYRDFIETWGPRGKATLPRGRFSSR